MKSSHRSIGLLFFFVFIGAILGSFVGDMLGNNIKYLATLKKYYTIGTSRPFSIDLKVMSISFGINFNMSLMSIIGIILAIILYRKFQ